MQQMNVLEYLEKTVLRVPEKTAFSNGEESLNFAQVYDHSRAIGSYLAKGGYYNEPVVVFMGKHPKCIPAFFGCVYCGCYYVPIGKLDLEGRVGQCLNYCTFEFNNVILRHIYLL